MIAKRQAQHHQQTNNDSGIIPIDSHSNNTTSITTRRKGNKSSYYTTLCNVAYFAFLFITSVTVTVIIGVIYGRHKHYPSNNSNDNEVVTFSTVKKLKSNTNKNIKKTTNACIWKEELLLGPCDGTKATTISQQYTTANECEDACCSNPECISFQYRTIDGCLFGNEVRLGNEKDSNVSAWCEPRKPSMWKGQWIHKKTKNRINNQDTFISVPGACTEVSSSDTDDGGDTTDNNEPVWNPNELNGQCFGLGVKRITNKYNVILHNTPEACQSACCIDIENCNIWMWRIDSGCFYHTNGFACQPKQTNNLYYEPFYGKRKYNPSRTYDPPAYSGDYIDMKLHP